MKKESYQIVFVYLMAIIFLYPVMAHILMYQLGYMTDKLPHGKFWMYMQIFFSGPVLIVLSLLLFFKYKGVINRILAVFLLAIAVYWLYNLINDIIQESA